MSDGELYRFLEKEYNGDMVYVSAYPDVRIGGLMPSRETIPLSLIHPLKEKLEYALLEIGVVVPSSKVNWKVKVNGISVTKEFKPHALSSMGDKLFAKLVYDITSILKTPESLRKRRVNVTFKTEGSSDILIKHIGILALYPTDEAHSYVSFLSGAVSLEPGEEREFYTEYNGGDGELKAIVYVPSKNARSRIIVNGNITREVSGIQGMDEITLSINQLPVRNTIKIIHEETSERYYPKELSISTILLYKQVYKTPKLEIVNIEVPEKIPVSGDNIRVKVKNSGVSAPDKVLVILMIHGNVVSRKIIDPIPPSGEETIELPVKLPAGEYDAVLRIVWSKLSKTYYNDNKISLHVS